MMLIIILPLAEAIVVYALLQGAFHVGALSLVLSVITFVIALVIGLLLSLVHGEVEYSADRADERAEVFSSALSKKRSSRVSIYRDERTVINDNRQVNMKGDFYGKDKGDSSSLTDER
jgi:hypothetical protein